MACLLPSNQFVQFLTEWSRHGELSRYASHSTLLPLSRAEAKLLEKLFAAERTFSCACRLYGACHKTSLVDQELACCDLIPCNASNHKSSQEKENPRGEGEAPSNSLH